MHTHLSRQRGPAPPGPHRHLLAAQRLTERQRRRPAWLGGGWRIHIALRHRHVKPADPQTWLGRYTRAEIQRGYTRIRVRGRIAGIHGSAADGLMVEIEGYGLVAAEACRLLRRRGGRAR